jgi:shikimate 5-dehydrogenase
MYRYSIARPARYRILDDVVEQGSQSGAGRGVQQRGCARNRGSRRDSNAVARHLQPCGAPWSLQLQPVTHGRGGTSKAALISLSPASQPLRGRCPAG